MPCPRIEGWIIPPSFDRVYFRVIGYKMVVSTYFNGNLAYSKSENWYYCNDSSPVFNNPRPCPKCGKLPTTEGYDACLGYIPNVKYACCGHGKPTRYIICKETEWTLIIALYVIVEKMLG